MMDVSKVDLGLVKTHEYKTQIKERHLDTFGHVNNAQYMILLEEARWEMCAARGFGLSAVHANGVGSVILECSIRFKKELRLREMICIETRLEKLVRSLVKVRQRVLKDHGVLAAEAEFLMGCFDLKERKLIPPTSDWLKALTGIEF